MAATDVELFLFRHLISIKWTGWYIFFKRRKKTTALKVFAVCLIYQLHYVIHFNTLIGCGSMQLHQESFRSAPIHAKPNMKKTSLHLRCHLSGDSRLPEWYQVNKHIFQNVNLSFLRYDKIDQPIWKLRNIIPMAWSSLHNTWEYEQLSPKAKQMPMLWCNQAMQPEVDSGWTRPEEITQTSQLRKHHTHFVSVWNNNEYSQYNCTSVQCSYSLTSDNQLVRFAI